MCLWLFEIFGTPVLVQIILVIISCFYTTTIISIKSDMKYVNVLLELSNLMILSADHLLSKIKRACGDSKTQ